MTQLFDLFGDPVPENWGGRGRPAHIATLENRNKVKMLLAFGWNNPRIAAALGITQPTLRKNYFHELKFRSEQRDRLDAAMAMKLWDEFSAGSVAAGREFRALLQHNDLMTYGQSSPPENEAKGPKLGKKEQALHDAQTPDTGSSLGDLMAQRQGNGQPPGGALN
jgi:hypothetical protein